MVAMDDFLPSYLELSYYPGVNFWFCFFYLRLPSLLAVMTVYGKSHDLKTKTPKTQAALYIFLHGQKPKGRVHSDAKIHLWIC